MAFELDVAQGVCPMGHWGPDAKKMFRFHKTCRIEGKLDANYESKVSATKITSSHGSAVQLSLECLASRMCQFMVLGAWVRPQAALQQHRIKMPWL